MSLLTFFAKLPFILPWNMLLLFIYTLELLWRVRRLLWDPRTWITIFFFYVGSNLLLLFFQLGLDLLLLIVTGKTLTDFLPSLGNFLSDYALSSAVTVLLFTTLASGLTLKWMELFRWTRIFREDVVKE
ncbi:MAG: hypothetical protein GXO00_01815, partial [Candidatus Diapherotrites archaeon]|nr:hypothetical protein [Candidatus Diapherotrites archaeon]